MPFLKTSDGFLIHYRTKGKGTPVVFLHGLGSCTDDWNIQTNYFRSTHHTITIDLRGHGKSDKPRPHKAEYSIKRMAKDVSEVFLHLKIKKAHLVGLSMGGCTALQLALDFPEKVYSLVLINTPVYGGGRRTIFRTQLSLRLFIARSFGVKPMATIIANRLFPRKDQINLRALARKRIRENPQWSYYASIQAIAGMNVEKKLDTLIKPTLIMIGEKDKIVHPILNKTLAKRLRKTAELILVKNAGHAIPLDSTEQFNTLLTDWLNK